MSLKEGLIDRFGVLVKGWFEPVNYPPFTEGSKGEGRIINRDFGAGVVMVKDQSGLLCKIHARHIHHRSKK